METAPSTGNNQTQQSICYCWPNNIVTEQSIMVAIEREIASWKKKKKNGRMGKSIMPLFKSFELSLASSVSTVLHDQPGRYGNIHKIGWLKICLIFFIYIRVTYIITSYTKHNFWIQDDTSLSQILKKFE